MTKSIVITGTRKGIGRHLVDHYLAKGYQVYGCSRSPFDEQLKNYTHYELDVADEDSVNNMVFDIQKKSDKIDALINNAGIASMNHVLLTPKSTLVNILNTNVVGTFLFAREIAKIMVRQNTGRIVNFATVATPLRLEGESIYAASKAAVASLTQVMAKELASYNITVNAVGPTPVMTDLIKNVPEDKMKALIGLQAIKRLGTYDDITNATDFFLQDSSEFITGQVLYLGGIAN
jgi:3-oxoacyl-[acyl-carrier protein] reductase